MCFFVFQTVKLMEDLAQKHRHQVPGGLRVPLRHYSLDFPFVCDSGAINSSKALWGSKLAVIIQLWAELVCHTFHSSLAEQILGKEEIWDIAVALDGSVSPQSKTALS